MSDGTYCPYCNWDQCLCLLTEEALQMRRERDEALAEVEEWKKFRASQINQEAQNALDYANVCRERDEARKQEHFLFLKHAALSQGLRIMEIQRDQARELAAMYLRRLVSRSLEQGKSIQLELKFLEQEFGESPWLKDEFKKLVDTERKVRELVEACREA